MQVCNDDNNIIEHEHKRMDERKRHVAIRNFRFHTPLPKASIQQLMNEEKGEIINEI